jgi:hypothetical protein
MSRQKLLDRLRHAGRVGHLAQEVAAEQAIDIVVSEAKPIPVEEAERKQKETATAPKKKAPAKRKAAAKEAAPADELWTPDKDKPAGEAGKLWTPGS